MLRFRLDEEEREFECFDNCLSRVTCQTILDGKSYPRIPFVQNVSVVMDVGANVGAASVFFSLSYPDATIYRVRAGRPSIRPARGEHRKPCQRANHNFGLYSSDVEVPMYRGKYETGMSSVARARAQGTRAT